MEINTWIEAEKVTPDDVVILKIDSYYFSLLSQEEDENISITTKIKKELKDKNVKVLWIPVVNGKLDTEVISVNDLEKYVQEITNKGV